MTILRCLSLFIVLTATPVFALEAGVAVRVVTPDPLLPVSGGMGPSNPAEGALGDLNVRALAIADDDTTVVIVSTDFLGFPSVWGDKIREQIDGVPPKNILIGASHTHSAPDMYCFPDGQGGMSCDMDYSNWVCEQTVEAISEALDSLQSVTVKLAEGEIAERIAYNYYAPELYDRRCNVMQFIDSKGDALATLVNYAIHPEVLGNRQGVLSPDMVGPLYERIEAMGGGTGVFMNGAIGGMVTADCRGPDGKDIQTWEECIRIGHLLADESLRLLEDAPTLADADLFCAATEIAFPVESPEMRAFVETNPLGYGLADDGTISAQVNVVNLGTAQVLTIPGEALPNIGFYLKRKMHGEQNFLFGLTNDAFGYMLTKEDFNSFRRYDYISRVSLGEHAGDIFVDEALAFVNECPRPSQAP